MVRGREIMLTIAFLLLNEHMEWLQLLLHMFDCVTDKFTNSHNIMLASTHSILLTCNHGLEVKIVIQMFRAALIAQWCRMCATIDCYLFVVGWAEHMRVSHWWWLHLGSWRSSSTSHHRLGGRCLLIMCHTAAADNTSEPTRTWLAATGTLTEEVGDTMERSPRARPIGSLVGGHADVVLWGTLFIIVRVHLKSLIL